MGGHGIHGFEQIPGNLVLSDAEVCQVGQVSELLAHLPDPVEPQVEGGEGGQPVIN